MCSTLVEPMVDVHDKTNTCLFSVQDGTQTKNKERFVHDGCGRKKEAKMFANLAVAFFMVHFTFVGVIFSETKLGKYSPLWHTVKELWPF